MTEPVVVTTGASSDIGEALALRLARDGAANVREEVAASFTPAFRYHSCRRAWCTPSSE